MSQQSPFRKRPSGPPGVSDAGRKIHVSNVSFNTQEGTLYNYFSAFGEITQVPACVCVYVAHRAGDHPTAARPVQGVRLRHVPRRRGCTGCAEPARRAHVGGCGGC